MSSPVKVTNSVRIHVGKNLYYVDEREDRYGKKRSVVSQALLSGQKGPPVGLVKDISEEAYELDIEGFGGGFAKELIFARPLEKRPVTFRESCLSLEKDALEVFSKDGIVVLRNVIFEEEADGLRLALCDAGGLSRNNHGQDPAIRRDKITFVSLLETENEEIVDEEDDVEDYESVHVGLTEEELETLHKTYTSKIGKLRNTLLPAYHLLENFAKQIEESWGFGSILCPPRGMAALYPGNGSHYTAHLDNEQDQDGIWRNYRVLTAILYVNPMDWKETDGGQLKYWLADGSENVVQPTSGTVVLFDSRRIKHEVLPARRDRFALTLWFLSPTFLEDQETCPKGDRYHLLFAKSKPKDSDGSRPAKKPKHSPHENGVSWTSDTNFFREVKSNETAESSFSFSFFSQS